MKKILMPLLILTLFFSFSANVFASEKVKQVRMSKSSMELEVGETRNLFVKFTPKTSSDTISWRSGNEEIATVDENGNVTAIKKGSTTITAKTEGGLRTTCRLTVKKVGEKTRVKDVEMAVSSMRIRVNQTRTLWVLFEPNDAFDQEVVWTSSDNNVATVDAEGTVTGVAPGTATITAESHNGYKTTCAVLVPGTVVQGLKEDVTNIDGPGSGELLTSQGVKTVVENAVRSTTKGQTPVAIFENKTSIPAPAIRAAAYTAKNLGRDIQLKFITENDQGSMQGWLIMNPSQLGETDQDIRVSVGSNTETAQAVQKKMQTHFSNRTAVIQCAQTDRFGMDVQISARVNLNGMETKNLRFYKYDVSENRYTSLEVPSYTYSSGGFLTFTSSTGGVIVVTDQPMTRK